MEGSDNNHCNITEENESVVSVQTDPTESSNFQAINESEGDSDFIGKSSDVLAKGLTSILCTIVKDFDSRAQETLRSQDQLSSAIDRLTRELDRLLEDAPVSFIMQHAAKISSIRKRVSSLNSVVKSIQGRIDNIDCLLSMGNSHEKTTTEGSG